MAFTNARASFLLVATSMLAATLADTVVVGESEGWRYDYDYTDWALKNAPFYYGDTLVFKYSPPSKKSQPHSVYLLPNLYSFVTCNFRRAKLLSSPSEGDGDGFSYMLNQWRPLYFASGEGDDCKEGMMKFVVVPLPPNSN